MRPIILLIFCLLAVQILRAQNAHGLVIMQYKPIQFQYNTALDMVNQQEISNAIEVRLNSAAVPLRVYAQLNFANALAQQQYNNSVGMRMVMKSGPTLQAGAGDVLLGNAPVLLFVQSPSSTVGIQNSYMFDFVLKPISRFIRPGTYNYSIIITVSSE